MEAATRAQENHAVPATFARSPNLRTGLSLNGFKLCCIELVLLGAAFEGVHKWKF